MRSFQWWLDMFVSKNKVEKVEEKVQSKMVVLTAAENVTMHEYEKGQASDNSLSIARTVDDDKDKTNDKYKIASE